MAPTSHPPLTPFGSALAGALGSVFANAVVYPLDIAKTRLQALEDPLEDPNDSEDEDEEAAPAKSDAEKAQVAEGKVQRQQKREQLATLRRILGKRLSRWGMLTMLLRILHTEGITGAFHGFSASMIGTFSQQFAYFFFHTLLRTTYLTRLTASAPSSSGKPTRGPSLSTSAELLLGALAGALAQIFTIPVNVIATRQQLWEPAPHPAITPEGTAPGKQQAPSLLATAKEIVSESGVTGLWTGLKPGLVLTVNPAITYGVFERLKTLRLASREGNGKLGVGESFWLGVGSKTLATVVTYPYIFAKVRLQAKAAESSGPPPLSESITSGDAPSYADIASAPPSSDSTIIVEHPSPSASAEKPPLEHTASQLERIHKHKHPHPPSQHYKTALPLLRAVYREKGIAGLYQGLGAQILKAVLCQGILFVSKDQFESYAWLLLVFFSRIRARILPA
ncbi:hypothetical protein IAT38_003927 [Cryptococcus sp. DSM 104549]